MRSGGILGATILALASNNDVRYEQLQVLLQKARQSELDIDAVTDPAGNTPMHMAAWDGNERVIRLLNSFGSSVSGVNEFGNTPIDEARAQGHESAVRLLESFAAMPSTVPLQDSQATLSLEGSMFLSGCSADMDPDDGSLGR